jgi:chemotaxis regulatin CheY-phosphate phosphatase CheZ
MTKVGKNDEMDSDTFSRLLDEVDEQVNSNLRSRIFVPDWQSFREKVEESKHRIVSGDEEAFLFRYKTDDSIIEFEMHQTRFANDYNDITKGYGFSEIRSLCCDSEKDNLLYDSDEETWYCPRCGYSDE